MITGKKILRCVVFYILPLVLAAMLESMYTITKLSGYYIHTGLTAAVIIELVFFQWYRSVRRRFPQEGMRRNIGICAMLFLGLNVLRVIKYFFVSPGGTAERYIWYLYYVPLIFGPLMMAHASLYFGKPDDYAVSKKWRWTFLPAGLIAAGILTNDLHQWAFRFDEGIEKGEDPSHPPPPEVRRRQLNNNWGIKKRSAKASLL